MRWLLQWLEPISSEVHTSWMSKYGFFRFIIFVCETSWAPYWTAVSAARMASISSSESLPDVPSIFMSHSEWNTFWNSQLPVHVVKEQDFHFQTQFLFWNTDGAKQLFEILIKHALRWFTSRWRSYFLRFLIDGKTSSKFNFYIFSFFLFWITNHLI